MTTFVPVSRRFATILLMEPLDALEVTIRLDHETGHAGQASERSRKAGSGTCLMRAAFCMGLALPAAFGLAAESTLYGGTFDTGLMIAADREGKTITGLFSDHGCRFYFSGPLRRIDGPGAGYFGEEYQVDAWRPETPRKPFTVNLYTSAREGFLRQVTLLPRGENLRGRCRDRLSVDRANNVSDSYYAVRVVKASTLQLYQYADVRDGERFVPDAGKPVPRRGMGVWVNKTYRPEPLTRGYVNIAWYDEDGKPRGAYVKASDLYPVRVRTQ